MLDDMSHDVIEKLVDIDDAANDAPISILVILRSLLYK